MIAGEGSTYLSDVELISIQTNNDLCDPLDLDYTVSFHSSVGTPIGILTCGGLTGSGSTSKCCKLQTKEGQTTTFPSMKVIRYRFGLGIVNDLVYAVGGQHKTWGADSTMEKINYKTESEWTLTNLPFSVVHHCLTTTTSSLVIIGGEDQSKWVSKIILSFVNENKKLKIKERINHLQKKFFGVS